MNDPVRVPHQPTAPKKSSERAVGADYSPERTELVKSVLPDLKAWADGEKLTFTDKIDLLQRSLLAALADRKGQTGVVAAKYIVELQRIRQFGFQKEVEEPAPQEPEPEPEPPASEEELDEELEAAEKDLDDWIDSQGRPGGT